MKRNGDDGSTPSPSPPPIQGGGSGSGVSSFPGLRALPKSLIIYLVPLLAFLLSPSFCPWPSLSLAVVGALVGGGVLSFWWVFPLLRRRRVRLQALHLITPFLADYLLILLLTISGYAAGNPQLIPLALTYSASSLLVKASFYGLLALRLEQLGETLTWSRKKLPGNLLPTYILQLKQREEAG